ncbi:hypothetical protein ABEB36_012846 [Hypothenemus hampei]|uniref:Uncharacterized protein n=1 Tax=Hypothenemus hampei TaxID=57062 RepID=A0ABD1E6U9_HYPHA
MFHKTEDLKGNFLEQTKNAREERALEKRREEAAVIIQAKIRSWLARIRYTQGILQDFDSLVPDLPENYTKEDFKQALDIYQQGLRLLSIWNEERDKDRFAKFCRYLVASLDFDSPKISYVGVGKYLMQ